METQDVIISDVISMNPDRMGGTPVFKGTRVHIKTLFDHLEQELPLAEFLESFPTVSRAQAMQVLAFARNLVTNDAFLHSLNKPSS